MPDAPSPALVLMVALAFGYLLGAIPFGLILTRLAGTRDLRSIGSGNIGATNVLRTGRKDLAAATLVLDALKGTAAVLLARHYGGEVAAMAAGAGAFIGHIAPVWLRFRGGKGVATYLGITLGLFWPAAVAFAIAWLGAAYYTRYSSLSALMATVATIGATMLLANDPLAMYFAVLAMVMWAKHHENIGRLFDGTEPKIGAKD